MGLLLTLIGAAASLMLVVVSVAANTTDNRIVIEKIELPESLQKAGIGPERIELMLQEALQTLVELDNPSLLTPGMAPNSQLRLTQLATPMARLRGQDTQVVWAGHVFFTDRMAYWLKSTFNVGAPQSLMSLRVSQLPEQGLDLHVHVRHSDRTQGYWALQVPEASALLQPQSPDMQQFAFYVLLASEPARAIELLLERDNKNCGCVSKETVRVLEAQAHRLSPYQQFSLMMNTDWTVVADPQASISQQPEDRELALLALRLRRELKEAPWPPLGTVTHHGACEFVDRRLHALAKTREERQSYDKDVFGHMAACIAKFQDVPTLERVGRDGLYMRRAQKQADELEIARDALFRAVMSELVMDVTRPENFSGVATYVEDSAAQRWPNDPSLSLLLETNALVVKKKRTELRDYLSAKLTSLVASDCFADAIKRGEKLSFSCAAEIASFFTAMGALAFVSPEQQTANPPLLSITPLVCPLFREMQPKVVESPLCMAHLSMSEEQQWDAKNALSWLEAAIRLDSQHRAMVPVLSPSMRAGVYQFAGWLRYQMGAEDAHVRRLMLAPAANDSLVASARDWYFATRCKRPEPPRLIVPKHLEGGVLSPSKQVGVFDFAQRGRLALQRGDTKGTREWATRLLLASREDRPVKMVGDHTNQSAFEGHLLMGMALMAEGYFEPASRSLEKAKEMRPYSREALLLLAMSNDRHVDKRHNKACAPVTERFSESVYLDIVWNDFDGAASENSDKQSGLTG